MLANCRCCCLGFGNAPIYSREEKFDQSKTNCKNQKLIKYGDYYAEKYCVKFGKVCEKYEFRAVLHKRGKIILSELKAVPGDCNELETFDDSKNCGLARKFM